MSHHIDKTHLKPGDKAPAFSSVDQEGKTHTLADYKGQKVVLYFYPADLTQGCTNQACAFRDDYSFYKKNNIVVLGVSPDGQAKHAKFATKYDLPFPLLVDEDHKILKDYGVWGDKKFMGRIINGVLRTTFIIDKDGKVAHIIERVVTKKASEQVKEALQP